MAISDKNIRITKNTNTPLGAGNGPKMVFTGASAGSSVITLYHFQAMKDKYFLLIATSL